MLKALLVTTLVCGFVAVQAGAQSEAASFAIRHVTVVDVVTGAERADQTVLVRGERIASVANTAEGDAVGATEIDGHEGFLIPGLWDMHVHVHAVAELPLYVANGVTGVRVMSGEKDDAAYRRQLEQGLPGPEIYLASAIVDGSDPLWPGSIVVKKADDARRTVDSIKAAGADFIKVYDGVPREAYFALADEARAQHIDFEGHVPEAVTAQEASAAGQRTMEHVSGIALACSNRQDSLMFAMVRARYFRDRLAVEAQGYQSLDGPKCGALFAEFRRNETWQVPTLTVRRMWGRLDDAKMMSDARLAYVGKRTRARWADRTMPMQRWSGEQFRLARGVYAADARVVGAMARAGVPLMAGTDAGNPYCFAGFSLHDELGLMVEAGLTPLAALQAATIAPARFLKRTGDIGTVEAGKVANLVLLRADPLKDIRNTTQIEAVWLRGTRFDRAALDGLLMHAKQAARQ